MTRGVLDQIPRSALTLLLLSQAAVIVPHAGRLAIWILGLWVVCVLWRILIHQGRWGYPPRLVKGLFVVFAGAGLVAVHGFAVSLDAAVALLVLAFALKLLEMRDRRDALVVIFLGYFVIATAFLFEQGIGLTVYQLGAVLLLTAALVALHQSWNRPRPLASLRTALIILVQALPLTLVVFVFFPRVAPLWSVPMPDQSSSRTGLAESMSPGEIASLGRSRELAFRVDFDDAPPPQAELYWRVLTYSNYDRGTWSPHRPEPARQLNDSAVFWIDGGRTPPDWLRAVEPHGPELRYSVLAEPSHRPWLYALDFAQPLTASTGVGRDFRVLHQRPVNQRLRYDVVSRSARLDPELPRWDQLRETALPPNGNPRTRAFVRRLHADGYRDTEPLALARRLLEFFGQEPFHYTLNPPTLGADDIDEFLFDTRRGFCGHYAGAFVYMMRLAGVPARVVAGYQGGERNPVGGYFVVRQYDAHAWAEIWIEGEGWKRFDPTFAVAPERIERGAEAAFADDAEEAAYGSFTGSRAWQMAWLIDAYHFLDSLEHRWNVFVVGYDASMQSGVLQKLLGEITPLRVAAAAGAAAAVAILISLSGALPRAMTRRRDPVLRLHDRFCRIFASAGAPREPRESPRGYGQRLATRYPELAGEIGVVSDALDDALFRPGPSAVRGRTRMAARALSSLRLRLLWRRLRLTFAKQSS